MESLQITPQRDAMTEPTETRCICEDDGNGFAIYSAACPNELHAQRAKAGWLRGLKHHADPLSTLARETAEQAEYVVKGFHASSANDHVNAITVIISAALRAAQRQQAEIDAQIAEGFIEGDDIAAAIRAAADPARPEP